MIFINLPAAGPAKSRKFCTGPGFLVNEGLCNDNTACVLISNTIYVMLMTHDRFRECINGEASNAHTTAEVPNCLTAQSRAAVDELVDKALTLGGNPWKDKPSDGSVPCHSFTDPDRHAWEVLCRGPVQT